MEDYNYQIDRTIGYIKVRNNSQTQAESATIIFSPPTRALVEEVDFISQIVTGGFIEANKDQSDNDKIEAIERRHQEDDERRRDGRESTGFTAKEVRLFLQSQQAVKTSKMLNVFERICLKSSTVDGETKTTKDFLDELSAGEYSNMMYGWIANFIMPSLL